MSASTSTTTSVPSPTLRPSETDHLGVTQRRVVKAEWIKLRSVRSTVIGLIAAVAVAVGLGLLFSSFAGSGQGGRPERASIDPLSLSLAGFNLSQLIIGVLGVSLVAGEYSTGLMRTTFSAVAGRLPVLWAKSIVFGGATLVVMLAAAFAAFFGGQALYGGAEPTVALSDPGVLRAVVGAAAYASGVGLLGVAIGFLLRTTAAGIGVLFAMLLLVPGLTGLLPDSIADPLTKVLPPNAGQAFMSVADNANLLSPTAGFLVFLLWVVGLLVAAGVAVKKRDA
jgi:ABC-2 type transport system permease protein